MSISNPGWWGLIGMAWVVTLGPGDVEGYIRPAATPLKLEQVYRYGKWVKFTGTTERLRPGCSFKRVEWFLGERTGPNVPTIVEIEAPQLRPLTGEIVLTDWRVFIGNAGSLENTWADVVHSCMTAGIRHPWEVRTRLWDPVKG